MRGGRLGRAAALASTAVLALGACDFSGGSRRGRVEPIYPLDVVGTARGVESCDAFDLVEGAPVALRLVGRSLTAEAASTLACTVVLLGDGASELGGTPGPTYLFGLTLEGDCLELPTDPLGDLGSVRFATSPLLSFACLGLREDGEPVIRCLVDARCRFRLSDFQVTPGFDVPAAIAEAIARAIDNLIDF